MGKNYGFEANFDFISITVFEMVKCTDVEFAAFQKKKFFKKREPGTSKEAEAIPTMSIFEVVAEVSVAPSEV